MITTGTVYAARAFSLSQTPTSGQVTFTFNFDDSTNYQLVVNYNSSSSALETAFANAGMNQVAVSYDPTQLRVVFHGVEKDVTSVSISGSFNSGVVTITEQLGLYAGLPGSSPVSYQHVDDFVEVMIVPPTNGVALIWYPAYGATKGSDVTLNELVSTTETYKVPSTYLVSIAWAGLAENTFDSMKFDGVPQTVYDGDDSDQWIEYVDLVPECTVTFHEV